MFAKSGVCGGPGLVGGGGVGIGIDGGNGVGVGGGCPNYRNKNIRGTLPPLTHAGLLGAGGHAGGTTHGNGGSHHLVARGVNGHDLICMKEEIQNGVNHYSGEQSHEIPACKDVEFVFNFI